MPLVLAYTESMIITILLSFFLSVQAADKPKEMCVYSHMKMELYFSIWHAVALVAVAQNRLEGKNTELTRVIRHDDTHCLTVEGDPKVVAKIEELYEEALRQEAFPIPKKNYVGTKSVDIYIIGIKESFLGLPGKPKKYITKLQQR